MTEQDSDEPRPTEVEITNFADVNHRFMDAITGDIRIGGAIIKAPPVEADESWIDDDPFATPQWVFAFLAAAFVAIGIWVIVLICQAVSAL